MGGRVQATHVRRATTIASARLAMFTGQNSLPRYVRSSGFSRKCLKFHQYYRVF